jgi:UDPglucose 6-dehydrogenase
MARICVVGLWHQGTVLAGCFSELGHDVVGVATDDGVVAGLQGGRPPLHEPGLAELVRAGLDAGRLRFTTDFSAGVADADFVYLSLDTPVGPGDEADLAPVVASAREIGRARSGDVVLCVTSQVPVGTSALLAAEVEAGLGGGRCRVAYVPEFLRLGTALDSFRSADRFIIGADDPELAGRVSALYEPLGRPIAVMDVRSAEMTKHASNAFLAASISFINEMADLCEEAGADVARVAEGMKLDRRIGPHAFLSAGLGFAGGTLGRDLRVLQALGREAGRATALVDAVVAVNLARSRLVPDLLARLHGSLDGIRVGLLGLTYKPGTSTLRRSVALEIARELTGVGAAVRAFDPHADLSELDGPLPFEPCPDPASAADGADALVVVTAWPEFRDLDLRWLRERVRRPDLVDTQNMYDPQLVADSGWMYYGIGRRSTSPMTMAAPAGALMSAAGVPPDDGRSP